MKTINVYKFEELNEKAQENARQWWRNVTAGDSYSWADESMKSIKALAEHFGGRVSNWSIDWFNNSHSTMDFEMPEYMTEKEISTRIHKLGKYNHTTGRGLGDCVLTGYCADESAIDGFRLAWRRGERDLDVLMQSAFKAWLKDCQDEAIAQLDDEYIDEVLTINEYYFESNGHKVSAA